MWPVSTRWLYSKLITAWWFDLILGQTAISTILPSFKIPFPKTVQRQDDILLKGFLNDINTAQFFFFLHSNAAIIAQYWFKCAHIFAGACESRWEMLAVTFTFNSRWQIAELQPAFMFLGFWHALVWRALTDKKARKIWAKSHYHLGPSPVLRGRAEIAGFLAKKKKRENLLLHSTQGKKYFICYRPSNGPSLQLHLT